MDIDNKNIEELAHVQQKILEEISNLRYGTLDDTPSLGQCVADRVVTAIGSWRFIIIQSIALVLWMLANVWFLAVSRWDPYPFILLNLVLSFQAAFTAPMILMAQNRSEQRDRRRAIDAYNSIEHIEKMMQSLMLGVKSFNEPKEEKASE